MIDLIAMVLPIVLLAAVGFAAVRFGLVSAEAVRALGQFVLRFALPALIVHAMLTQDLRETMDWGYLAAYGAGSLVAFALAFAASRWLLGRARDMAAISALGGCAANSGFIGFPVASLALGDPALTALPLSMLVETMLVIPLALGLAQVSGKRDREATGGLRGTLGGLLRTPIIIAILTSVVLAALGVRLPEFLAKPIGLMAGAAVPCALFVIGGTLATMRASQFTADVPLIVLVKLAVHPAAVAAAFAIIGTVPRELAAAGIILAGAPMLTIYPIIGARFGHEQTAAAALFAATVAGTLTLVVVLALVM